MIRLRTMAMCAVAMALYAPRADSQDLSHYRDFVLGSDLAAVSSRTGVPASQATVIHERPALLQELTWRPSRWVPGTATQSTDPVEQIRFDFYNDQLFRIIVDYAAARTAGMTDTDMIEAISVAYGPPPSRTARIAPSLARPETDGGVPVARWGDAEYALVLSRTSSYGAPLRLTMTALSLSDLAGKAEAQAIRLDAQEAPRREIERQKKERDDYRNAAEKARAGNKGDFRP